MSILPIAAWGDQTTPFQIATREPIQHHPGASFVRDRLWEYANGHLGFYSWLRTANRQIGRITGIILLDLPDRCWRDEYDERVPPSEAADLAIDEAAAEFGIDPP
jgi:hypothetical protein